MEKRQEIEEKPDGKSDEEKKGETSASILKSKRAGRIQYESSFATSAFTTRQGQKRPPGFIGSSLDFKPKLASASSASVTTKPGRNDKIKKQYQQQQERDQQRQYRSGQSQPTRAQGNFGPPPHSVKTLEDLENMSEEEIYKLFMDDPQLHETIMRATEKKTRPTSTPNGSHKSRRADEKKPTKSPKRSASNRAESKDREVPYFQWIFLVFVFGCMIHFFLKPSIKAVDAKGKNVPKKKVKREKQKSKNGMKTSKKVVVNPMFQAESQKDSNHVDSTKASENKNRKVSGDFKLPNKKKKKKTKRKEKSVVEMKAHLGQHEHENKPDMDNSTDQVQEIEASNTITQSPIVEATELDNDDIEDEWQTVTKSTKVGKKEKRHVSASIDDSEEVVGDESMDANKVKRKDLDQVPNLVESSTKSIAPGSVSETGNTTKKVLVDLDTATNPIASSEDSGFIEKKSKQRRKKNKDSPISEKAQSNSADYKPISQSSEDLGCDSQKLVSESETKDDAALALKLHEEEINLARASMANPQEEAWEEVMTKKKRVSKV